MSKKPKELIVWDGHANCITEEPDDMGGGAYCVSVEAYSIYDSKNVRKLINWLEKAEKWIEKKESKYD